MIYSIVQFPMGPFSITVKRRCDTLSMASSDNKDDILDQLTGDRDTALTQADLALTISLFNRVHAVTVADIWTDEFIEITNEDRP